MVWRPRSFKWLGRKFTMTRAERPPTMRSLNLTFQEDRLS